MDFFRKNDILIHLGGHNLSDVSQFENLSNMVSLSVSLSPFMILSYKAIQNLTND